MAAELQGQLPPKHPNLALKGSACERTLCDPDAELSWQGF